MKNLILSIPTPSSSIIPRVRVSNRALVAILVVLIPTVFISSWFLIPFAAVAYLLALRMVQEIRAIKFELDLDDPITQEIYDDLWI